MKFDVDRRPKRHSYSSISTYLECPAAYGYSYLMGIKTQETAAMSRGTRLHKLCEDYMRDHTRTAPVPYDVRKIGVKLYQYRQRGAKAEETWLLDHHWEPVVDQGRAKVKAIVDLHYMDGDVLHVYDYKSGRQYPSHTDQLELYSVIGLLKYPSAKRVESGAVYIDSGVTGAEGSIIREMLPHYLKRWDGYIGRMEADSGFEPTPGNHCGRCDHSRFNGGPCTAAVKVK
jgi:hypothetical protein